VRRLRVTLAVGILVSASAGCGPGESVPNPALKRPEAPPGFKRPVVKEKGKAPAENPPKR
jgi:hypothetical protein